MPIDQINLSAIERRYGEEAYKTMLHILKSPITADDKAMEIVRAFRDKGKLLPNNDRRTISFQAARRWVIAWNAGKVIGEVPYDKH